MAKKIFKQFFVFFLIFLSLAGCTSTKTIRENTWDFLKMNDEKIHYYIYSYNEIRAPTAEEIEESENQVFLFLRLYNPYSSFNIGSNILQKGIEFTETHDTSGSHISLGFDLTDNFYGLTLYAKPNLKIEQCTDTSTNEYMKSCNPKKSLQTTYALPVTQEEYDTARAWINRKIETKSAFYNTAENFKIAGKLINPNSDKGKAKKPLSQQEAFLAFEEKNKFVCSTFICNVLYCSVENIRTYMNENLIDPNFTTPTDIVFLPKMQKLFTSNWADYKIAAENFAQMNPLFLEYL